MAMCRQEAERKPTHTHKCIEKRRKRVDQMFLLPEVLIVRVTYRYIPILLLLLLYVQVYNNIAIYVCVCVCKRPPQYPARVGGDDCGRGGASFLSHAVVDFYVPDRALAPYFVSRILFT